MRRDGEGNVLVRAMVHVSIPVDLVFTREQYLDPDYVRRAAIENFIGHPALYDPDGPLSDHAAELAGEPLVDSVLIDGRDWMNPAFQTAEPAPRQNEPEGDTDG